MWLDVVVVFVMLANPSALASHSRAHSPRLHDGPGCVVWQAPEPLLRRARVVGVRNLDLQAKCETDVQGQGQGLSWQGRAHWTGVSSTGKWGLRAKPSSLLSRAEASPRTTSTPAPG